MHTAGDRERREVYEAYLNRQELVSGGVAAPNWTADGNAFWYVEGAPADTRILQVDLETGDTTPMFDVAGVRAALAAATGHEPPYRGLPFDRFVQTPDGRVEFNYEGTPWRLDPKTHGLERIRSFSAQFGLSREVGLNDSDAERWIPRTWTRNEYLVDGWHVPEQLSPDREWFASVRNHNVVLRSTRVDKELSLTSCGTADCFWDLETRRLKISRDWKVRMTDGVIPWSPDSLTLLAYRRDIHGVFRMPRVNWLKPFEDVEYVPYPKAGAKLDRIDAAFIDVRSGRQTFAAFESTEDCYIHLLGWHPSGTEAVLIVYARDFKRLDIFAAHRETGAIRALLTESATTFVKIQHESIYYGEHGFRMLPDGSGFLWLSTRDGWNHLYRYNWSGELTGKLTTGDWPVHAVEHIGQDGFVYFMASIDTARPYDVHVCRVSLSGGKVEQLTREKGIHAPTFAPNGRAFLDTHSTVDRPVRTDLVRSDGSHLRTLSAMDISRLVEVGYTPPEEFTVKAADGVTDLWGVMYKPFDFDSSRRYPVIESIYGGAQTIWAQRFFVVEPVYLNKAWALAQLGYIVVSLDARGTPGRSKAFHDAVYGDLKAGVQDHAAALRQLCARHAWMDASRVGIYGASSGGYYAACALIDAPDVYQAAVCTAPGFDPWDMMIAEPYLGLPRQNRAAYERAELFKQVGRIKGKMLIVVGTCDHGTFNSAMKMTRALIDHGIDHELVVIPQALHGFFGAEEDYYLMKLTQWFDRYVKNRQPE